MQYQSNSRIDRNEFFTDPLVPDPDNLPEPLGWSLLVRPYPMQTKTRSGLYMADETLDHMNYVANIARVVAVGPCCWSQNQHKNINGERFEWVKVGDFVSYPRHVGNRKKFKGVGYVTLMDDEITERLPDPLVFDYEGTLVNINIPQEHLETYNTIYNKDYKHNG